LDQDRGKGGSVGKKKGINMPLARHQGKKATFVSHLAQKERGMACTKIATQDFTKKLSEGDLTKESGGGNCS